MSLCNVFFVFLIHFLFEYSDGFGTLPKFALPALHSSKFEHGVMCDCQIEWYTAVPKNMSWKKIHFHFSLHDYHSIQLQLFPVRILVFLIKCWLLMPSENPPCAYQVPLDQIDTFGHFWPFIEIPPVQIGFLWVRLMYLAVFQGWFSLGLMHGLLNN